MLEPNFTLPDKQIAINETSKRLKLIDWFKDYIRPSVAGLIVTGSMSYGQNYSVKPTSDIDMQLLVTPETVDELAQSDCFSADELNRAIYGYKEGLYKQFSLVFQKEGVPMECHFWDEQASIDAITFKSENTLRLRSGIDKPSTDFGYSFERKESRQDYFGEMIDGFAVADFPSYRRVNGILYLCRPITNILGIPLVIISNEQLESAIELCWSRAVNELLAIHDNNSVELDAYNIVNTLPGKNKMSEQALQKVQEKTKEEIRKITIK